MSKPITRRNAIKAAASVFAIPAAFRHHTLAAAPSEAVRLMAVGAGGRGHSDIMEMAESPNFRLVAIADVDPGSKSVKDTLKKYPDAKVFTDFRKMFDTVKDVDAVSVSTPDHMHAPAAMRALQMGKAVCCQKPLTHTLHEARQLAKVAAANKLVTQMGIQIHSHPVHKTVVKLIQDGAIGKVKEVHSWSGKDWGDRGPKPAKTDPVPEGLAWDEWLGVAAPRPYIKGYYHPGNWRKRLDFGCGTFGDMGCHIFDPVFKAVGLTSPVSVRSEGPAPNSHSWATDAVIRYVFPETPFTIKGKIPVTWYDGNQRPPADVRALLDGRELPDQGSIVIGTGGVMVIPHVAMPILLPDSKFKGFKLPEVKGANHWHQFVDAVRGVGKTSANFGYAGPLTEAVLLGSVATRFPNTTLDWSGRRLKFTNVKEANQFVRRTYRKGWETKGL